MSAESSYEKHKQLKIQIETGLSYSVIQCQQPSEYERLVTKIKNLAIFF